MGARIVAVVDAFSAMMDKQVNKEANTLQETIDELKRFAGRQFDPNVVTAFLQVLETADDFDFLDTPQQKGQEKILVSLDEGA